MQHALRWFDATHELEVRDGRDGRAPTFRRIGLPGGGSMGDQDAKLMDALDLLRAVHHDVLRLRRAKGDPRG